MKTYDQRMPGSGFNTPFRRPGTIYKDHPIKYVYGNLFLRLYDTHTVYPTIRDTKQTDIN